MMLIGGSIMIALLLVSISLALYASSGAEQLDLSRPGYAQIREQAERNDQFQGFKSSGDLDKTALEHFKRLYDEKMKEVNSVDAFGGDVLSPESLQIDQASATTQAQSQ